MRTPRTRASGRSGIAAVGLAGAQLLVLATIHTDYLIVMAIVLVAITAFAAFKLCRDNCVESRIALASVAAASVLGIALNSTIGLPGVSAHTIQLPEAVLLLGALLVLVTIMFEARTGHTLPRPRSPYAL